MLEGQAWLDPTQSPSGRAQNVLHRLPPSLMDRAAGAPGVPYEAPILVAAGHTQPSLHEQAGELAGGLASLGPACLTH